MPKTKKVADDQGEKEFLNRKAETKKGSKVEKTIKKTKKPSKELGEENLWPVGKNRYVKVCEFMGDVRVDIRCYFFKNGDIHPGKAGISLALEQWERFMESVTEIDEAVKATKIRGPSKKGV